MLQIRLSNKAAASESGGGAKLPTGETVTVACPDHLVIAELPVAKSLGSASGVTLVKTVGRRSRRPLGDRVHFCVQCDYPIAIYGRLIPCEHVYCLDCARSDSICYLCDERIQKIQTIKMMEGIFICAAPHCLKSFLKRADFVTHINTFHTDLLNSIPQKDVNDPEPKKPTTSDSTVQAPTPRPVQESEDRPPRPQPQPPLRPLMTPKPTPQQQFQQQTFETPSQQQGIISQTPYTEYPMQPPPNFVNPNVFGQPVYVGQEGGVEQGGGSLLGYPQPWNGGAPFDPSVMMNQGGGYFQGGQPSNIPQGKDSRDGRGVLASAPSLPPPPPPLPPPFAQIPGGFYGGDASHPGQGYGWQQEKRDGFGNGQD